MTREMRASGLEALGLVTMLLQRARRADPLIGVWEAADLQWWWRVPRPSDDLAQVFWFDEEGPVAGAWLTSWAQGRWQCDLIAVPGAQGPAPEVWWARAMEHGAAHAPAGFDVPVGDDDQVTHDLARASGLTPGDSDSTAWMGPAERPAPLPPPEGFAVVDRTQRQHSRHPLVSRSGEDVARRLGQVSLYDPSLDLAVETTDGRIAGYSLYWYDPTTRVGLVEPVRVEDEFQRRGLARVMLTEGIDRLFARGATRVKVSYQTEAAGALYLGLGFTRTSTTSWWRWSPDADSPA